MRKNFYRGNIVPEKDTIMVFGSNFMGIHGAGSALSARKYFGAQHGVGTGLTGNSYALPTTDLNKKGRPNVDQKTIINNIIDMYECATEHPEKNFKVAYRNQPDEVTLCGYSGRDLMGMFREAGKRFGGIPDNVWFSEEWNPHF